MPIFFHRYILTYIGLIRVKYNNFQIQVTINIILIYLMFLILYRYQYIIVEMSTYIIGTHFAFGLNRFGLTLVEFTNGLTAPQDVAHP
jgi:hypothetical protein